jgi:hypothetical protein
VVGLQHVNHGGDALCPGFVADGEDDAGVFGFYLLVVDSWRVQPYLGAAVVTERSRNAGAEKGEEEQGEDYSHVKILAFVKNPAIANIIYLK